MDNQQNGQNNGGVMDVQSPQTSSGGTPPSAPVSEAAPSAQTKSNGLSPELLAEAQKETANTETPTANPDSGDKNGAKKSRKPLVAVLLAVVVFLGLSGVAGYAYMQSQDDKKAEQTVQEHEDHSAEEHAETQPATTDDVKDAAKELDDTVNASDEATELPEDGLTEQSVGL